MAEEAPETRAGEPRPSSEPARQTEGLYTGAVPVVRLNGSAGPQKALRALPADLLEALVVLTTLDEELPTLQRALGGDQELVHVDRLHDDVVGAELQAGDRRLHVGGAGQHDHGDVVVGVVLDDQDLAPRHVSPPPPTGRSWRGAYPPKVSLCKVRWTLRKALDSGKRLVHPAPMESAR